MKVYAVYILTVLLIIPTRKRFDVT